MAVGFLDEPEVEEVLIHCDVVQEVWRLNHLSQFSRTEVDLLQILKSFNECFQSRLLNYREIPFPVIRCHYMCIELSTICKHNCDVISQNVNSNDFGSASQYLAMLHHAIASNLDQFCRFLREASRNIVLSHKLIEKLCVILNSSSIPYVSNFVDFDEHITDPWMEVKRRKLQTFINHGLQGKNSSDFF